MIKLVVFHTFLMKLYVLSKLGMESKGVRTDWENPIFLGVIESIFPRILRPTDSFWNGDF